MRKRGQRSYGRGLYELILLVLELKVPFQKLVDGEERGMSRDAAAGYHLGALPKAQEALLPVEDGRSLEEVEALATRLQVCLMISV